MKPAAIGDVFAITTPTGSGYFQVIGRSHVSDFDLIRVFKGARSDAAVDELVREDEAFLTTFPVAPLARMREIRRVGSGDVPPRLRDRPLMRAPGLVDQRSGRRWWMFLNAQGEIVGKTVDLTAAEAALSIDGIPTPSQLAEWISSGWTPSDWR